MVRCGRSIWEVLALVSHFLFHIYIRAVRLDRLNLFPIASFTSLGDNVRTPFENK